MDQIPAPVEGLVRYRGFDPFEDTARLDHPIRCLGIHEGYRGFDPFEDTASSMSTRRQSREHSMLQGVRSV